MRGTRRVGEPAPPRRVRPASRIGSASLDPELAGAVGRPTRGSTTRPPSTTAAAFRRAAAVAEVWHRCPRRCRHRAPARRHMQPRRRLGGAVGALVPEPQVEPDLERLLGARRHCCVGAGQACGCRHCACSRCWPRRSRQVMAPGRPYHHPYSSDRSTNYGGALPPISSARDRGADDELDRKTSSLRSGLAADSKITLPPLTRRRGGVMRQAGCPRICFCVTIFSSLMYE